MQRKEILYRIREIIADLNEQCERFENNPENIDGIEMEFFAANVKFLSDHALILEKLNFNHKSSPSGEEKADTNLSEPSAIEFSEPAEEINSGIPEFEAEKPKHPETFTETGITEDNVKPTLNDLMAGKAGNNLAAKFSNTSVKDLKSGISLNDKLVFIKDLFNGYSLAYQEAIDKLDQLDDFQSAELFLKTHYFEQYKWSEKTASTQKFYEILIRRFPK